MAAHYKLVHFTPDPFKGSRFALGALVTTDKGEVRPVQVEELPCTDCLGDRALAVTVQRLHVRLSTITSADELPAVFGPYTHLSEPRPVPDGVRDPVGWVRSLLTPCPSTERTDPMTTTDHDDPTAEEPQALPFAAAPAPMRGN